MQPAPAHPPPASTGPILRESAGELSLEFEDGTLQSRTLRTDPARLLLEYTRLMMGFLLFRPAPRRIAMIGLGGGALARYCAAKLPDADFTAVEVSTEVIALRTGCGVPLDGPRFHVLREDGAAFVRRDGDPLDVLLVDGFDGRGQPEELCSPAFYDACRDRLAPDGVLVANLHVDEGGHGARVDPLYDAFDGRIVVVDADGSANVVVFGGVAAEFPPSFHRLVEHLRSLGATHPVGLESTLRKIAQHRAPRARHGMRPRSGRLPASSQGAGEAYRGQ